MIEQLERVFSDTDIFPTVRESQKEYARTLVRALLESESLELSATGVATVEADTGVGKSLAYLLALMLYSGNTGNRVAVATYTKHLRAELEKEAAKLQDAVFAQTNVVIKVAVRYAQRDYIDIDYLDGWIERCTDDLQLKQANDFRKWLLGCLKDRNFGSGRYDDYFNENARIDDLYSEDVCLDSLSSEFAKQCFDRHVDDSKGADLLIITQAMFVVHAKCWFTVLDDEREVKALVVDEADNLPAVAAQVFSKQTALHKQLHLFDELSFLERAKLAFEQMLELLCYEADGANSIFVSQNNRQMVASIQSVITALDDAFGAKAFELARTHETLKDIYILKQELELFVAVCDSVLQGKTVSVLPAIEFSAVYNFPRLKLIPSDPSFLLNRIYGIEDESGINTIIYTSATLSYVNAKKQRDYKVFERAVGLLVNERGENRTGKVKLLRHLTNHYEPSEFGKINIYQCPPSLAPPYSSTDTYKGYSANLAWLDYVISTIKHTRKLASIIDCGRRTLVLVKSFQVAQLLGEQLTELRDVLIHHQESNLEQLTEQYHANDQAVLISPSLWAGFDSRTANLIMAQLPFSPRKSDGDSSKSLKEKQARFLLFKEAKQGIGRGTRHHDDKCRIFFCDSRFPYYAVKNQEQLNPLSKPASGLQYALPDRFLSAWRQASILEF